MKKVASIVSVLITIVLFSCNANGGSKKEGNIHVTGKLENVAGKKIQLEQFVNNQPEIVDTSIVEEDGSFVETINVNTVAQEDLTPVVEPKGDMEDVVTPVVNTELLNNTDVAVEETMAVEQKPEAYAIPDFKSVSATAAPLNLDISKAKRVALNEILPASEV